MRAGALLPFRSRGSVQSYFSESITLYHSPIAYSPVQRESRPFAKIKPTTIEYPVIGHVQALAKHTRESRLLLTAKRGLTKPNAKQAFNTHERHLPYLTQQNARQSPTLSNAFATLPRLRSGRHATLETSKPSFATLSFARMLEQRTPLRVAAVRRGLDCWTERTPAVLFVVNAFDVPSHVRGHSCIFAVPCSSTSDLGTMLN